MAKQFPIEAYLQASQPRTPDAAYISQALTTGIGAYEKQKALQESKQEKQFDKSSALFKTLMSAGYEPKVDGKKPSMEDFQALSTGNIDKTKKITFEKSNVLNFMGNNVNVPDGFEVTGYDSKGIPKINKIKTEKKFDPMSEGGLRAANVLRDDFNKATSSFEVVKFNYLNMEAALSHALKASDNKTKAAADQALVTSFNKMLDPTSVVRESEYARTGEGQSAIATVQGFVEKVSQGGTGLTDINRKDAVEVARGLIEKAQDRYRKQRDDYKRKADKFGIDPDLVLGQDYSIDFKAKKEASKNEFNSVAEAEAANLPIGTKIFIQGREAVIE